MATGTYVTFEEAKASCIQNWIATDEIWVAIIDNTVAPTAADVAPELADYTQVGAAGTYVTGGLLIDTWGDIITEAAGIVTFDPSAVTPSWAAHASNDTDAHWAIIYNTTQANDPCLGFMDLGGPVDMTLGPLQINWNASGLSRIS